MGKKKLVLIDGNSLINRAFYALPGLSNSQGVSTNAIFGFNTLLLKIIKNENPDYIAVCFDKGGMLKRKEEYSEYKANRKGMPEELREQMPLVKEYLKSMNIYQWELEGYEADDLIGTLAKMGEDENLENIIYSADKDLLQLITDNTKVCLTKKGISELEIVDKDELDKLYSLTPNQMIELKALMGDSSDNIPGVKGVGEKTALKLIQEYGSLDEVYNNLDKFKGKKIGENLENDREKAYLSKSLGTIVKDIANDIKLESLTFEEPDLNAIIDFYREMEISPDSFYATFDFQEENIEENFEEIYTLKNADEVEKILEISSFDDLTFYLENRDEKRFLLFLIDDIAYEIELDEEKEILMKFKKYFHDEGIIKITFDSKEIYLLLNKYDIPMVNLRWDIQLQAYLLNPEEKELDIKALSLKYLKINYSEENKVESLVCLRDLSIVLAEKLEKDQLILLYSGIELPIANVLAKMEAEGVKVDFRKLQNIRQNFKKKVMALNNEICAIAEEEFNVNSPKQLGKILFEKLGLPVIKKTKTGYSTNAEVLEELKDKHEIIEKIISYRSLSKLVSTYIEGFSGLIDPETRKVHTSYHQTVTATGRLSSSDPNLQNIPIRSEEGRRIRSIFIPSKEGCILLGADYSQIELRVLAHISGDKELIDAFKHDQDIHAKTASEVFGIPIEKVTKDDRRKAKAINFGIIYGLSDYGLAKDLGITRKEAREYIDLYFERYEGVKKWIDEIVHEAREKGYVTTLLGRRRYLKDINSKNFNLRSFAERTAVNTPIQGTAADIIKLAMLKIQARINEKNLDTRMIMQIHDELIFEVPPKESSRMVTIIRENMENAYPLNVPLTIDLKAGFNLNDMEKI